MKKTVLRKVISIFLALLMICSTLPMMFTANAAKSVETSVDTDSNGATVTTEKGKNYTKMTYSMTMGTAGNAGNYVVYKVDQAENYYKGSNGGNIADNNTYVGVVIKIPVVFAVNLTNVDITATTAADGRIAYYVSTTQPATIAERNPGLVYTTGWAPKGVQATKDLSAKAVEVLAADSDATALYITIGANVVDWNAPQISAVEISVTYNTTWKTEYTKDSKGANITTTTKGNDYTQIDYSFTCGTAGTGANYRVAGGQGTDYDGEWQSYTTYAFPVQFAENVVGFTGAVRSIPAQPCNFKVYVGVTDAKTFGDPVATLAKDANGATYSFNFSSEVKTLLAANPNASFIYIKFAYNTNGNAPKLASVAAQVTYNTTWSTETTTDENDAVISTLTKGTDYTQIDYSFTCGTAGTGANYRVAGGQGTDYDGEWESYTTYAFPVQYAENVIGFAGTVKSISAQPCNFKVYVGVTDAKTFGDPVATLAENTNGATYSFDFSSEVKTLLAANPNASNIYIKFAYNTNGNAPKLASVAAQVTYNTTWEALTETDANGAVIETLYKGQTTAKTYSFTCGTAGTGANYRVAGGQGTDYDGEWESYTTYAFPVYDAENVTGFKGTVKSISAQPCNFKVYVGVTDAKTFGDPVATLAENANGATYSFDFSSEVKTLLAANPNASNIYIKFAYNTNGNAPKLASVAAQVTYNSFIVDSDIKAVDVSLDGTIGLKLGLVMPSSILNSANTVKVLDSASNPVAEIAADEYEEVEGYKFFAVDVPAAYMTEAYTLQVVTADATYTASAAYSVRDYAVGMMETADDETYALLEAMLNYGAFAQTYFGINTDDLANDDGQDGAILWAYTPDDLNDMVVLPESNESSKVMGDTFYKIYANVDLESAIAINVQFVNGEDKTLYTKEIVAKELLDTHTFEHDGATFTISFNDYAHKVLNDEVTADNTALTDLVKATLLYGSAASEYFAAQAN